MTQSELMDTIFERPAMYLGHASVIKMQAFVEGFGFGRGEPDPIYAGFAQWVVDQYEGLGQHEWSAVATLKGVTELGAFDVARSFWKRYKESIESRK